ncbi:MAG TPA: hypothetical protein VLG28_16235 [Acidimicrobiia bacterium]|jgi:hypothetical protein|nr:hypothetical protein [Acidimicrobiia bacterium]
MRKTLLVAAVMMLLTTACRAEANFLVDVAEDGSGTVTVEFGLDDELQELLEGFGGGTEDLFAQVPDGQDLETRTEGDMTYFFTSEAFSDPEGLEEAAGVVEDADASFEEFEVAVDDGAATLNAIIETPNATEALEGLGGDALGGFDLAGDFFTSSLVVSLPGELVETNADEILADGRLRWDIPLSGGTVVVQAETESAGGGVPWGLIGGIAGAVLVIGGLIWLSQRRNRSSVSAVESTAQPAPPKDVFDTQDTTSDGDGLIR